MITFTLQLNATLNSVNRRTARSVARRIPAIQRFWPESAKKGSHPQTLLPYWLQSPPWSLLWQWPIVWIKPSNGSRSIIIKFSWSKMLFFFLSSFSKSGRVFDYSNVGLYEIGISIFILFGYTTWMVEYFVLRVPVFWFWEDRIWQKNSGLNFIEKNIKHVVGGVEGEKWDEFG